MLVVHRCRRLQTAKEKLHRLQELVAMVQHSSPDAAQALPSSIAALASDIGLDDPDSDTRVIVSTSPRSRQIAPASPLSRPPGGSGSGMMAATGPLPTTAMESSFGQRYDSLFEYFHSINAIPLQVNINISHRHFSSLSSLIIHHQKS